MMIMKSPSFEVKNGRNKYHLIPYLGNKSGFSHIFDRLISDSMKGKIYDVFGGTGSFSIYSCYRFGSKNVTYNDNNPTLVNFVTEVKNNPKLLHKEYEKHRKKSSEDYYRDVRQTDLDDGLVGAGRFLYLAKNAFSGNIRFGKTNNFKSVMRKNVKCSNMSLERLTMASKIISQMKITNEDYKYFEDEKNGFFYLDPPYMENPHNYYNGLLNTDDFLRFLRKIGKKNQVMLSEQNDPHKLQLSENFRVYPVLLKRSPHYNAKNNSREIIAINYAPPQRTMHDELVA